MSESKRPGGLTALAVFNFIWVAFSGLGLLMLAGMLVVFSTASAEIPEEMMEIKDAIDEAGITRGFWAVILAVSVVKTLLLLLSGIGYLKQKKFMGRTLGNTYALIAIAESLVFVVMLPVEAGGGMNLGTIFNLIYPIVTLLCVNMFFKDDLVN